MLAHMNRQSERACKALATFEAVVRLFASVNPHVAVHVGLTGRSITTQIALERLLASMTTHMCVQAHASGKTTTTHTAKIRLFAGVKPHVGVHVGFARRSEIAQVTVVGPRASMTTHMCDPAIASGETTTTHTAEARLVAGVNSLVHKKLAATRSANGTEGAVVPSHQEGRDAKEEKVAIWKTRKSQCGTEQKFEVLDYILLGRV